MKLDPVERALLARALANTPGAKSRFFYETGRPRVAEIDKEIQRLRFAAEAQAISGDHPKTNAAHSKKGWKPVRSPTPGKHSGAHPDYNFVR